jgi:hypothetical protein
MLGYRVFELLTPGVARHRSSTPSCSTTSSASLLLGTSATACACPCPTCSERQRRGASTVWGSNPPKGENGRSQRVNAVHLYMFQAMGCRVLWLWAHLGMRQQGLEKIDRPSRRGILKSRSTRQTGVSSCQRLATQHFICNDDLPCIVHCSMGTFQMEHGEGSALGCDPASV